MAGEPKLRRNSTEYIDLSINIGESSDEDGNNQFTENETDVNDRGGHGNIDTLFTSSDPEGRARMDFPSAHDSDAFLLPEEMDEDRSSSLYGRSNNNSGNTTTTNNINSSNNKNSNHSSANSNSVDAKQRGASANTSGTAAASVEPSSRKQNKQQLFRSPHAIDPLAEMDPDDPYLLEDNREYAMGGRLARREMAKRKKYRCIYVETVSCIYVALFVWKKS